jgi:hypothetical protein
VFALRRVGTLTSLTWLSGPARAAQVSGSAAGAFREGIEAMGGPGRSKGESIGALEEAVQIIHAFWSGNRSLRFEGKYYTVKGTRPGPRPAHPIGLWLGTYGPRALGITGWLADGWLPTSSYASPQRLPEMQQRINDAALSADRQPRNIRRIYNVMGLITAGPVQDFLVGPLDYWVDELTRLVVEVGMDTLSLATCTLYNGIHYADRPLDGDSPGLRTASCATKVCAYRSQRYTQMRGIIVAALGAAGEI